MFLNISNIIHTQNGKTFISIILGLGLASLFRKSCSEKKCFTFKAPPSHEVEDTFYRHGSDCYTFTTQTLPCTNKNHISFA
jgi:hypothetical protein